MTEGAITIGPSAPVRHLWPLDRHERGNSGTRAVNALRRGQVATVGELCGKTPLDIADIPQAGASVLAEVRAALAARGLSLKDDDGASLAEVSDRVRRLTRAGVARPVALRFARQSWPEGEIAPGIRIEVAE
jgi:hypothetical protein